MNSIYLEKFKSYYPNFFKILNAEKINNLLIESDQDTLLFLKDIILEFYDPEASLQSSDVLYIKENPININNIRYIGKFISYKPDILKYRFVLLMNIENMTVEAGNALLKALEESKKYVVFINFTSNSHKILKTILSRSLSFKLNPIKIKEELPEKMTKSINGSFGKYLIYLKNKGRKISIENLENAIDIYVNSFIDSDLSIYREFGWDFFKKYDPLKVSFSIEKKVEKISLNIKEKIISDLIEHLIDENYKEITFATKLKENMELHLNFSTTLLVILRKINKSYKEKAYA